MAHRVLGDGDGSISAKALICMQAAKTSSFLTMKTRLRNRKPTTASSSRAHGCTCGSCWWKARRCRRSLGNFYTLRDLLLKGYKASAIRYLLASVPYRRQLNFTFDGLKSAEHSVERLRNFRERLQTGKFAEGKNPELQKLAAETRSRMRAGMEDDLNTAQALAAVFDMIREANTEADQGRLHSGDTEPLLRVIEEFDSIFAVLDDGDAEKTRKAVEWAQREGRKIEDASLLAHDSLSDADVERLLSERTSAKRGRDFARADAIRKELTDKGILVEDSKDGTRWKRR